MSKQIWAIDMFNLKKGMKLLLKDGREIELTSNYIADGMKYQYTEGSGEIKEISILAVVGSTLVE